MSYVFLFIFSVNSSFAAIFRIFISALKLRERFPVATDCDFIAQFLQNPFIPIFLMFIADQIVYALVQVLLGQFF